MTELVSEQVGRGRAPGAEAASGAMELACAYLRDRHLRDHWAGTLSSSALATSMSIVALHVADAAGYRDQIRRGRRWLLRMQRSDGGWGDAAHEGPADESNVNATSLAIGALALTASEPDGGDAAIERATRRLRDFGGWAAVGDPARCTLSGPCRTVAALAGIMDFKRIKRLRPEVILLPRRLRRTISTTFPAYLSIATLHAARARHPLSSLPTYPLAARRAIDWLRRAQGPDGSFEESAFLTSVIIACLLSAGLPASPWLRSALRFVLASQRDDGGWPIDRDLETFDTALAVLALREAGLAVPRAEQVRDWLLARQFREGCFPTSAPAGGWAWAMPAGWPDSDDTAYTVLALRALGVPGDHPALRLGARWLERMQSADGSWPTFVRGSRMPFDHDCPYITGHVLSALHATGRLAENPRVLERALGYLAKAQRHDGSFASIWFRDGTAGTASVLEALGDCGLTGHPIAARARDALLALQNDDGGWSGLRHEGSTAEETSWAIMALLQCPPSGAIDRAVRRGVSWLAARQRFDGTWEPAPIGLYYSAMWYSDSQYAVALPLRAIARARARDAGA